MNNTIGQALLAKKSGKPRVIAETGAGQHGVATATVAARLGLACEIYMGAEDVERQKLNVYRMRLLGAEVIPVESGTRTLKDAMNEALRDWVTNVDDTFYIIGTVAGPHPYPMLVRDFNAVVGREARRQSLEEFGRLPDALIACVGGVPMPWGSSIPLPRMTTLHDRRGSRRRWAGDRPSRGAAGVRRARGVLHGNRTYLMSDEGGQVSDTHSVSAGLDYPGVGPEHAFWKDVGRVEYVAADDAEVLEAFRELTHVEGIMPALESAHALAHAKRLAPTMRPDQHIVVNLSGRGDKDIMTVAKLDGIEF